MTAVAVVISLMAGGFAIDNVLAAPAHIDVVTHSPAGLAAVGPTNSSPEFGGFPMWYKDTNDIRLELCVDQNNPLCIAGFRPDPSQPVSFPNNFPDEAFWWSGAATMRTAAGSARLVLGLEAAFVSGLPTIGEQVAFSRVRLRVDGLPAGQYTVTHPYGVDVYDVGAAAANATKSINSTSDIGDFTGNCCFDGALAGPTGPFLVWDGSDPLPPGYLADPAVSHTVTGSPYNTNFFQIEGPVGAFGNSDACPGISDGSCIRTDLFNVQAKQSLRAGVEVTRSGHTTSTNGHVDLFAKSDYGQTIVVSGTDVIQTAMAGDGNGGYFVRIPYTTTVPTDIVLTNTTDNPISEARLASVADEVHVKSAIYDATASTLTVTAASNDERAVLKLDWAGAGTPTTVGVPGGVYTFTVVGIDVPPAAVTVRTVTPLLGGTDSDDVEILGGVSAVPIALAAVITISPSSGPLTPGSTFSLNGSASSGSIDTYTWEQTDGPWVAPFATATPTVTGKIIPGLVVPDLGNGGTLAFELVVQRGVAPDLLSDLATVTVNVAAGVPLVADAGMPQNLVPAGTTVTLDGSASTGAATYEWIQVSGPVVAIAGASTINPTFVAPSSDTPVVVELTATNLNASPSTSTAQVSITSVVDVLTVTQSLYKSNKERWRIGGTAQYCAGLNVVSVELMRLNGINEPVSIGVIGTAAPVQVAASCIWDIRLEPAAAAIQPKPNDWLRATSRLGGSFDQAITFG